MFGKSGFEYNPQSDDINSKLVEDKENEINSLKERL